MNETYTEEPEIGLRGYRVVDQSRTAERRSAILRAAARVFAEKGYREATMEDVAQAMGVSRGVVYYQFRSKEEVYTEIMVAAIGESLRLLRITAGGQGTAPDRLRRAVRELIAWNLDETTAGWYSKLVSGNLRGITGKNRETIRSLQRDYHHLVVSVIREGQADGSIQVRDANIAALNLLTAANGVSNWFVPGRALDAGAVADEVSDQLIGGILKK